MFNKQVKSGNKSVGIHVEEMTITFEPLKQNNESTQELALMEHLGVLAQSEPSSAIDPLLEAIEKYPHIPQCCQYLCIAYQALENQKKCDEWIKKTYERFPNYLFAKCGYAHLKMHNDHINEVPQIFNNTFSLKSLYPKRSTFHASEVMVHANCMAHYFCKIGEFERIKPYVSIMQQLDPDSENTCHFLAILSLFDGPERPNRAERRRR